MVANILIAIGFFFAGVTSAVLICANEIHKVRKEIQNKRFIVYEF